MNQSNIKVTFLFLFVTHFFFADAQNFTSLQNLNWLTGSWLDFDSTLIEKWIVENEGLFAGEVTDFKTQERQEILQLVLKEGSIYYCALPKQNKEWTDFELTFAKNGTWIFENLEHDFPKKITNKKINRNRLEVMVESENKTLKFKYFRVEVKEDTVNM